MSKYKIIWSPKFNDELYHVLDYLLFEFKEPLLARKFKEKVLTSLSILNYFPEGYPIIKVKNKIFRKLLVDNYVIIYEVNKDTRTSLYFTYFSW